jgi:hypothetical protein
MGDPPTPADRWGIGLVLSALTCAAVVVLTYQQDLQWWSTTLQFGGALIASLGLGWSYLRASGIWERRWPSIRAWLWRIFRIDSGPQVVGAMGAGMGVFGFHAMGRVTYNLDHTRSVEEQIAQLEGFINRVIVQEITPIREDIVKLKDSVKEARTLAESKAREVLIKTRAEIAALALRLDRTQALDIRWAIVGLFISAIGTSLQYGT